MSPAPADHEANDTIQSGERNRTMLNQRTIFAYTHSFGRLARQAVVCTAAVVALTACGGDGGSTDLTIMPEPPGTLEDARTAPITTVGTTIRGTLSSRDDVDFFRFSFDAPGRLMLDIEGTARTQIKAYDGNGNRIPVVDGSVVIPHQGGEVFVEVSAAPGAGASSTGTYFIDTQALPPDTTASSTPPTI